MNLVKQGVDNIYNLRFDVAREAVRKLEESWPEHPVLYLMNGMITYWENYPLLPSSSESRSYETDMRSCINASEKYTGDTDKAEYLLANLGASGMLLLFYADNKLSDNVFPLARKTYRHIRQAFDYTSYYPDFLFFTGLYNYYREAYPDVHPVYKVLALFFPKGDRVRGLTEMQKAAEMSIMLKAESSSFLSHIWSSFENNHTKAYTYSNYLHEQYPANLQYLAAHIRNALLIKRYGEAEELLRLSGNSTGNPYFEAQRMIFKGIIREKKYHDYKSARTYYHSGISGILSHGSYGNEFAAYAYFGLSRISEDRQERNACRKKALELTAYMDITFD